MTPPVFGTLDITNSDQIARFEKGLFRAFFGSADDSLDLIWNTDRPSRRMSPKIPYASLEIYTACVEDALVTAVAVNFDMTGLLQLEMLGFTIDKSRTNTCEGLAIFNIQPFDGTNLIAFLMRDYGQVQLAQRGIQTVYGTCTQRRLRGYQAIGFKSVDHRTIKGITEHLLEMQI